MNPMGSKRGEFGFNAQVQNAHKVAAPAIKELPTDAGLPTDKFRTIGYNQHQIDRSTLHEIYQIPTDADDVAMSTEFNIAVMKPLESALKILGTNVNLQANCLKLREKIQEATTKRSELILASKKGLETDLKELEYELKIQAINNVYQRTLQWILITHQKTLLISISALEKSVVLNQNQKLLETLKRDLRTVEEIEPRLYVSPFYRLSEISQLEWESLRKSPNFAQLRNRTAEIMPHLFFENMLQMDDFTPEFFLDIKRALVNTWELFFPFHYVTSPAQLELYDEHLKKIKDHLEPLNDLDSREINQAKRSLISAFSPPIKEREKVLPSEREQNLQRLDREKIEARTAKEKVQVRLNEMKEHIGILLSLNKKDGESLWKDDFNAFWPNHLSLPEDEGLRRRMICTAVVDHAKDSIEKSFKKITNRTSFFNPIPEIILSQKDPRIQLLLFKWVTLLSLIFISDDTAADIVDDSFSINGLCDLIRSDKFDPATLMIQTRDQLYKWRKSNHPLSMINTSPPLTISPPTVPPKSLAGSPPTAKPMASSPPATFLPKSTSSTSIESLQKPSAVRRNTLGGHFVPLEQESFKPFPVHPSRSRSNANLSRLEPREPSFYGDPVRHSQISPDTAVPPTPRPANNGSSSRASHMEDLGKKED